MRYWLARLAFSFLVVAAACAWEAFREGRAPSHRWVLGVGAAVGAGFGLAGLRERHCGDDDGSNGGSESDGGV